jgi:diguanylate cyclase (GGDEF)-like protein/PAS domain S-box-containing protein
MNRRASWFGVPDGLALAGVFGGALVLAALAFESLPAATAGALALVAACGVLLAVRLRQAATAVKRSTRQVEEAGSRLQVLVEHVPAAVYIDMADPDVSDGGRLAYMSPQICGILGYRPDEFVNDPELWPSRIHPDDRAAAIAAYGEHWRTGEPLRAEYRMLALDGTEVWVRDEAYAIPEDGTGRRISQGLLIDTTDRKRLESKLIHDALHDPLTGVANRVLMRDHLERALARREPAPGRVALLFIDLDDFKRVNDSFGHATGDQILVQVAERMNGAVRGEDVVGRQSGDEFAALLTSVTDITAAVSAADRILRELRRPIVLGGRSIVVGGSIGIALATGRGVTTAEDLITQADAAMYAAKRSGKGTFAIYEPAMPTRTWTELEAAG